MPVTPVEAAWLPNNSPTPNHIYKDENITVYGIPVIPSPLSVDQSIPSASTSSELPSAMTMDATLKRKREQSPHHPAKRTSLATEAVATSVTLQDHMAEPSFSPQLLSGDAAEQWRRLMIRTMFPGSKPNQNEKAETQKRREEQNDDAKGSKKAHKGKLTRGGKLHGTATTRDSPSEPMTVPLVEVKAPEATDPANVSSVELRRCPRSNSPSIG